MPAAIDPGMEYQFRFGRRQDDQRIITQFHTGRQLIFIDVQRVQGVALEQIHTRADGRMMAVIAVDVAWGSGLYFMNYREEWKLADYFKFAEQRRAELNLAGDTKE